MSDTYLTPYAAAISQIEPYGQPYIQNALKNLSENAYKNLIENISYSPTGRDLFNKASWGNVQNPKLHGMKAYDDLLKGLTGYVGGLPPNTTTAEMINSAPYKLYSKFRDAYGYSAGLDDIPYDLDEEDLLKLEYGPVKKYNKTLKALGKIASGAKKVVPALNAIAVAHDLGIPFIKRSIESFDDLVNNNGEKLVERYAPLKEIGDL